MTTAIQQESYARTAASVIHNLEKRNMTGSYAPTAADALTQVKAYLSPSISAACGGSETLSQIGFPQAVEESHCTFYSRFEARKNPEIAGKIASCDVFFLSTNAITLDGQLVNIDGAADRLSRLLWGPKQVVVIAGMNKLSATVDEALNRVHLSAAPPNAARLNKQTPCALTGVCADCQSPDCICCQTVITRRSAVKGRIHVILVGEALGF